MTESDALLRQQLNLSPAKRALLEKLMRGQLKATTIPQRQQSDSVPLSFAQERLWFIEQLTPNQPLYNEPSALRLRGTLNVTVLVQSLNEIVRRHEVLRTTFETVDEQSQQIIAPSLILEVPIVNLQSLPLQAQEDEVQRIATEEAKQPFNLKTGPLLRATLLQLDAQEYVLLLTMHHIICDRWSGTVLMREIAALYSAFSQSQSSPLTELSIQYADFAVWQRQWLVREVLEKQITYWQHQLDSAPTLLELPTDKPRPTIMSYRGARQSVVLSKELTEKLKQLAQQESATLFMTLLAAFQTLLYRYTQQEDILVGTTIAGRNREELESLIGFFINTLVLRTNFSGNPNFQELLAQVREVALGAYAHQDLPFEQLVEKLQPQRSLSYTPLFQVMFQLQNNPTSSLEVPGLSLMPLKFDNETAKFDLSVEMIDSEHGLIANLEYNTDIFYADTMTRLLGHLQTLLKGIVANPRQRLSDLPLLTANEQHQLLVEWNNTQTDYPQYLCIHQLFEAQVEKTPDTVAVVFENEYLTYKELNQRANQLAYYLRKLGVGPEVLVGICVERSLEMVVGLLGILKAGGAYLPLDTSCPQERLTDILSNSQASIILTQQHLIKMLPIQTVKVVCLDSENIMLNNNRQENLSTQVTFDNLAYVMYTSGSTGKPKGVSIIHRGVVRLVKGNNYASLNVHQVLLQLAPLAFDASTFEIWGSLVNGAKLVIMPPENPSLQDIKQVIKQHQVTILWLTANLFHLMVNEQLENLQSVHQLLAGGDVLSVPHIQKVLFELQQCQLINGYGPTENTTFTCCYSLTRDSIIATSVPIGKPIANTKIYILDHHLQLVPIGISGELYTSGDGLARGYFNRPDLTAETFIPNPWSSKPDSHLYKTGDLARHLPDGNVEFIGRIDHQVKIRGFRIELGDIEAAIHQHPEIREVVVRVREDRQDDKRLVAYIVSHSTHISVLELRKFLKAKLPDYMIPSAFVVLEKFPFTPNGKIDRRALPAPNTIQQSEEDILLDLTPVQEMLAGIWAEILGIKQVGIQDNFFELGGHSLLATRVISKIRKAFKIDLPLRCLFESPTVAELAKEIEKVKQAKLHLNLRRIEPASRLDKIPLSFSQQRLWYLDQLQPNSTAFNIFNALRIIGSLNISALEQSLNKIIHRHEILRTNFTLVNGEPIQVIFPSLTLKINTLDLNELPDNEREHTANQLAQKEAAKPFSLDKEPLVRVTLVRLTEADYILLFTMHHIISDGWSTEVLIKELVKLYEAFCVGKPSPLPELSIQYADFAIWQRQYFKGEVIENQLGYWKQQLKNLPILKLPTDYPRPNIAKYRGAKQTLTLSTALIEGIKSLSLREGTTIFMTLLAAFKSVLHYYSGQEDIVVGTDIANRNISETEDLIGFFVNQLVLRTSVTGNPTFSELLQRVREVALGAYSHQNLPFDVLVNALNPERNLNLSPLFQVKFIFDNTQTPTLVLPGLTISSIQIPNSSTQLDLILRLTKTSQGIIANLEYNTDIFTSTTITQILRFWEIVLNQVVNNATARLQELVDAIAALDKEQKNLAKIKHKQDIQQKLKTIKRKNINYT